MRFLIPATVTANTTFRNVISCSLVDMHRRFRRTCFHRLGSLPAHLFKTSVPTVPHDVTRWKRVTHSFLGAVTCGSTDGLAFSVHPAVCRRKGCGRHGTVQRVSLLPLRGPNFIFPAWRHYAECNFIFLSVLPGRNRGSASFCTATTTLHILFN